MCWIVRSAIVGVAGSLRNRIAIPPPDRAACFFLFKQYELSEAVDEAPPGELSDGAALNAATKQSVSGLLVQGFQGLMAHPTLLQTAALRPLGVRSL